MDCFGDVSETGKTGSDLREAKCTWLTCRAMEKMVAINSEKLLDIFKVPIMEADFTWESTFRLLNCLGSGYRVTLPKFAYAENLMNGGAENLKYIAVPRNVIKHKRAITFKESWFPTCQIPTMISSRILSTNHSHK